MNDYNYIDPFSNMNAPLENNRPNLSFDSVAQHSALYMPVRSQSDTRSAAVVR